jgi:arginyl-tRNA--protein-N-Asp/Glu arginylyltransferase
MFKDLHILPRITGAMLDEYLALGWYRMGQIIFTTDYLYKEEQYLRVFWLRYRMDLFRFTKKQEKQLQLPEGFTVSNQPLRITEEMETLYQLYRNQIDFEVSPTLRENLFSLCFISSEEAPAFDSWVIEIRDKGKLIAAGVYDMGEQTMMGIINFYDPAYKKYSLGKRLILFKLRESLERKLTYYYPGYIVLNYPKFDYKLEAGENICEIYDTVNDRWIPYSKENIVLTEWPQPVG